MKEVNNKKLSTKVNLDDEINLSSNNDELIGPEYNLEQLNYDIDEDIYSNYNAYEKRNFKIFLAFVICILIIAILLLIKIVSPKITLKGDKKIKLSYNEKYIEQGATAKYFGKNITNKIKIKNNVDESKIGKYKVEYKVKGTLLTSKKTRLVEVVDEIPPTIELDGEEEVFVCPKEEYKEIGFKAFDEYDGDITKNVETELKDDSITYKVLDSSKNEFKIIRKINRNDIEKPVINLNGSNNIQVKLGATFNEPGYTATDNCSGDLTDKVKVTGSVDTNTLGTYEIKYTVSDFSDNETIVTRKVVVQKEYPKKASNFSCGEDGVVYLTFDDGPNNSTTTQILDILKKYDVKATFFVTNTNGGSDSQIKREFDEGHLVALHTNSHEYSKVYANDTAYWNDLNAISNRVEKITGKRSTFIRFPGGSSNTVSRHYSSGIMSRLVYDVESKGYTYFDWNIDSRDAEGKPSNEIYSNVTRNLSKSRGNVVLMHDIKTTTANAIEDIIKYGINNGYQFKVLDSSVKCWHKTNN